MDSLSSQQSEWQDENMLTPRSKVAKMLADIDAAPTPSPPQKHKSPEEQVDNAADGLGDSSDVDATDVTRTLDELSGPLRQSSDEESDEDIIPIRRPQGRAARRMLSKMPSSPPGQRAQRVLDESDDELYSVTPGKETSKVTSSSGSPDNQQSNGLFVSPAKSAGDGSDDDLPTNPVGTKERSQSLIAQKRAERLAREAEERANRGPSSDLPQDLFEDSQGDAPDSNVDKIPSDASRPARKTSKKALLEMERETQRLSRQQALAHQMRVKKKFTTNDLFAKFNIRREGPNASKSVEAVADSNPTSSSAPNSDGPEEAGKHPVSTPPSSPPTPFDRQKALVEQGALSKLVPAREDSLVSLTDEILGGDLPEISDVLRTSQVVPTADDGPAQTEKRGLKLARLGKKAVIANEGDGDDDLEIVSTHPTHLRAFDRAMKTAQHGRPADSKAVHVLKHLSNLNSGEGHSAKRGARRSVDPKTLEAQLRRRMKEQARRQQLEKIEELRAKGIDIQTSEEREKEAEAFEDLLEKARQEAVQVRKAERAARKQAGDETVEISDDEDEDQDYVGSESEEEEALGEDENEAEEQALVDGEADEENNEEDEEEDGDDEDGGDEADQNVADNGFEDEHDAQSEGAADLEEEQHVSAKAGPRLRKSRVVVDEDDEDLEPAQEAEDADHAQITMDPFAAFNFGAGNNALPLMSPTQAFNATMQMPSQATQDDTFEMLRNFAPPSLSTAPLRLPDVDTQLDDESQPTLGACNQVPESQQVDLYWETQPPETPSGAGANKDVMSIMETPGWEPTQDRGLPSPWSMASHLRCESTRESTSESMAEQKTQSTVPLRISESPAPSQPTIPRKGRLGRRKLPLTSDSEDEGVAPAASVQPKRKDAFREMERRRKQDLTALERANIEKEMREMMDEQAEESEDEYAGLGGDDFVAPETEQDRDMIDSSHVEVDERAIAAHFAEREREREEKETSRLYKDLTTGMLRRKMAANAFDLDEDDDEIAARRRQMRQMEEAKKRRALLKDDNIANLANGKPSRGTEAFLRAIADDDGETDAYDIADEEVVEATQNDDTQSQSQQVAIGPLRETTGNKRKYDAGQDIGKDRPPAKQRRTQPSDFRKPTSLLEVRESVSFLLEDPHAGHAYGPSILDNLSDSEDEYGEVDFDEDDAAQNEEARNNDGGFAPDPVPPASRTMPPPRLPASQRRTAPKPAVVDRLSLRRSASSGSESAHSRTAWASGPSTGGFKVPSLLRRATTNTASAGNVRGVTTPVLSRENSGLKMGGSKKSSLAYQARAEERRAIVEAGAKQREENRARIAQMRRNSSALNRGLAGRFE